MQRYKKNSYQQAKWDKKMKNKNMEEKELKAKDIPGGYAMMSFTICFSEASGSSSLK